jgi:hypothetical protein
MLTHKGVKTIDEAMKAHMEGERELANILKPAEQDALAKLLKKLLLHLEESCI